MKSRQRVGAVMAVVGVVGLVLLLLVHRSSTALPAVDDVPVSPIIRPPPQPSESSVTVPATPRKPHRIAPSEGISLRIPGVLSASFGGAILPNAENSLVPPTYTQVFRWAQRGRPGCPNHDTVFILGHTVRAGGGVFNHLQEVRKGQLVLVRTESGVIRYKVISTKLYDKEGITSEDDVYARDPGRLVLIGCYLNRDGSIQTKNFVATARIINC